MSYKIAQLLYELSGLQSTLELPSLKVNLVLFQKTRKKQCGRQSTQLETSTAGGMGSIPGWGAKMPHAAQDSQNIFLGASQLLLVIKNVPANVGVQRHRFNSWVEKIPWERAWQPTPVFLPGESHGQWTLVGYSPQGCKEWNITEVTEHVCTNFYIIIDIYFQLLEKLISYFIFV